jgi:hypothetical protein
LSPLWIAIASTVPILLGLIVAMPLWYLRLEVIGNVTGATLIFMMTIGMIAREWMALENLRLAKCPDTDTFCPPDPGNFTKFAIYGFIGLAQVVVLFLISLRVERMIRNRGVAPEWRS